MTTHNGKRITQRGGADAGRGDDAHGVTPVSRMLEIINRDGLSIPFESKSVGDLHDMRMFDNRNS